MIAVKESQHTGYPNVSNIVDLAQAASLLQVAPDDIRYWEKKGLVKAKKILNKQRFFDLEELRNLQQSYLSSDQAPRQFRILKTSTPRDYNVIELFSGCGGLALGLDHAGLHTKLLVEIDRDCVSTLKLNRPEWDVIHADIAKVNLKKFQGQVDILAGGFPCQAFSYAGHSLGFADTRGTLFFEFARCIQDIMPKIAVAENVRGLLRHDNGRTLDTMMNVLRDIGYRVNYKLLRSQFFDVPQKRERLVIIASRNDLDMPIIFPDENKYTVPLREALQNCPSSLGAQYPSRKKEIMAMVPPGGYWRDLPIDIQKEYMKKSFYLGGGKTGMARRLSWDEPSLTLTCSPSQKQTERCHPAETRPLNIREYARIQSFPDSWEFTGSMASQYKQIGNAVPVNLAFHIGTSLIKMLDVQGSNIPFFIHRTYAKKG